MKIKIILLSLFAIGICVLNSSINLNNDTINIDLGYSTKLAYAENEYGVDPGSCSNFNCTYYVISGPIRVWDPYTNEWILVYSQDGVPGHYKDCENDGWANVCLCDPNCYEGSVGNT